MPGDIQGPSNKQKAVAAIAAAAAIAAPLAASFEGYAPRAYKDPAGIPTYCYGETQMLKYDPSHIYAQTECMDLLRHRMAQAFAPKLLQCVPAFIDIRYRYEFGALLDASYNTGTGAACRSPMAVAFNHGQWAQGCRNFNGWYVTAHDRRTGQRIALKGLVRRRGAESSTCMKGL